MEHTASQRGPGRGPGREAHGTWRRVLMVAGLVVAALVLAIVGVYAVTFVILAPMMQ